MNQLMLNEVEIKKLIQVVLKLEDVNGNDIYSLVPVINNSCDKYDCWFGSTKCTCQGICDGRN